MRRLLVPVVLAALSGCNNDAPLAPDRPITAVTVSPTATSLLVGQSAFLSAAITGGYGSTTIKWTSSNAAIASVSDSGVVTARALGTAKITATAGGVSGTADVTVTSGVNSVIVTTPASALLVGQTVQLSVQTTGIAVSPAVAWSSSNAAVATVSATGQVVAVGAGSATVSASAGGVTGAVTLTVTTGSVDRVAVCNRADTTGCTSAATLVAVGTSATVRAYAYNAIGADISSACVFQWAPAASGVLTITFFGDNTKRDALITRAGAGITSIVVTCGGTPGVFTVDGLAATPPATP